MSGTALTARCDDGRLKHKTSWTTNEWASIIVSDEDVTETAWQLLSERDQMKHSVAPLKYIGDTQKEQSVLIKEGINRLLKRIA